MHDLDIEFRITPWRKRFGPRAWGAHHSNHRAPWCANPVSYTLFIYTFRCQTRHYGPHCVRLIEAPYNMWVEELKVQGCVLTLSGGVNFNPTVTITTQRQPCRPTLAHGGCTVAEAQGTVVHNAWLALLTSRGGVLIVLPFTTNMLQEETSSRYRSVLASKYTTSA